MLHVTGLTLNIPSAALAAPLSFKLLEGKLLWVRGDNGAGKSTLLKTVLGLLPSASGTIDWPQGRPKLFYLAHDLALQPQLTVLQYCQWHPAISQILTAQDCSEALSTVGLLSQAHQLTGQLSRGQQQRLLLACALLSEATCWLLDEPLTALDIKSRETILSCLLAHKARGGSALVVSHYPIPEISDEVLDVLA